MQIFSVSRLQVNHPKGDQDSIPDVVSSKFSKSCESTCSSNRNASPVGSFFIAMLTESNLPG